jgi:predicted DNA-binding transcriptional regulator AlpA
MNSDLLTASEVAARLRVSKAWVFDHSTGRHRPVLPSIKLGKARRYRPEDIDAFIEQCRAAMERGLPIQ